MGVVRSIYVSAEASEADVRRVVEQWMNGTNGPLAVDVEFADEYPGYVTAVDVWTGNKEELALTAARALEEVLRLQLPLARVALDVDLDEAEVAG